MTKKSSSIALEKGWEYKDRVYKLTSGSYPWYKIRCSDDPVSRGKNKRLLWFDEGLGYQRSLRYGSNQRSVFQDEQEGIVAQEPVIFKHGFLAVPKENVGLQKLLSLYHPWNAETEGGRSIFAEVKPGEKAAKENKVLATKAEALALALKLEFNEQEAVARVRNGGSTLNLNPDEIKHLVLSYANENPIEFTDLVNSDELLLVHLAYKSIDVGIAEIVDGGRTYKFKGNSKPLFRIPLGEDSYEAIGGWFKTDEGHEVVNKITKLLKKK